MVDKRKLRSNERETRQTSKRNKTKVDNDGKIQIRSIKLYKAKKIENLKRKKRITTCNSPEKSKIHKPDESPQRNRSEVDGNSIMITRRNQKSNLPSNGKNTKTPSNTSKKIKNCVTAPNNLKSPRQQPSIKKSKEEKNSLREIEQENLTNSQIATVKNNDSSLHSAAGRLFNHLGKKHSSLPDKLPCREKEFDYILEQILTAIQDDQGGCLYISGVPGTGKTATVKKIIQMLEAAV